MNTQNEHPTNIPPEQDKGKKPGLFSIIFCYILSAGCFIFAILGIVGNMRMKAINASYGIPSSTGQLGYDIGVWFGRNLPVIIAIILGIVFFRAAKKDHEARREWEDK
ncbi:MAG: hypothetical protein IKW20_01780 [Bacteroidales bacterium]|nr:hypothetical protein [Bacteroidales bacterium]